jgi:sulfatase maturation enzyme AslB (radical SAM superfamily)
MTNRHKKLLKLIADPSVVNIIYNTNGTFLLDNETVDILKSFKNVDFILSIDGYAELNEKVRSGSKWSDILAFIDQIQKSDFNLTIHTVLHKNNWHGIGKIKEFVDSIGKPWTINILTYPKKLDISTIENKEDVRNLFQSIDFPNKDQILRHLYES